MQREVGHESVLVLDLFYPKLSLLQNKKKRPKARKAFQRLVGSLRGRGEGSCKPVH